LLLTNKFELFALQREPSQMIISSSALVEQARQNIKEIDVQALNTLLSDNLCLIDVREPGEFNAGHIKGAVNMPRGVLEMQLCNHPSVAGNADALAKLSDKDIYLICRSGGRSALAAESMQRMGFEKVYSMAGGMIAWEREGLPFGQ
jgi:rhodanese-related sulfurtransferase